jgi:hypothetical protein
MLNKKALLATSVSVFFAIVVVAQAAEPQSKQWKAPRTAEGHPDLQGVWTNATITPLERQPQFGDRLTISATEAKALEQEQADFREEQDKPTDPKLGILDLPKDCGGGFSGVNCGYNNFWVDPGSHLISINGESRTSIVVEPKNGRVPPLKPEARARLAKMYAAYRSSGGADGPELRPLGERCILSFDSSAGPPMLPLLYNNNYQIVQTNDTIVIHVEMVHDARIVRMNAKHRPASMKFWMGDSIGRWEGETLVIETTNFRPDQSFRGASENMRVTERLTRISPQQILYRFTIEDPASFETSWTGELAFNATNQNIFEYACHEGNYALPGILAGAREEERAKAAKEAR